MNNLQISTRISLLIGVLILVILGVGYLGLSGMRMSNESLRTVYEDRTVALGQLATVQRLVTRNQHLLSMALHQTTTEAASKVLEEFSGNVEQVTKTYDAYLAVMSQ